MENQIKLGEKSIAGDNIEEVVLAAAADKTIPAPLPTNFVFVNLTNPDEANDPNTQRFVRQQVQRKYKKAVAIYADSERFPVPEESDLPFVSISHPSQASSVGAKRFIRQQVQLRHHRAKARKKDGGEKEREEVKPEGTTAVAGMDAYVLHFRASDGAEGNKRAWRRQKSPLSPGPNISSLIYPIQMNEETSRLVEYLHADTESTNIIPAFREIWFGMILMDSASFYQQMSTTIQHQVFVHGIGDPNQALMYHQKALRSVNERLSDPVLGLSDGVVGTVVSFLTYDNIVQDVESYEIHKKGLARIIQLRGGIETLEDSKLVRLMILWEEVCGACAFNILPNYPLPKHYLPPVPPTSPVPQGKPLRDTLCRLKTRFPERGEFVQIFHDLHVLNSMIEAGLPDVWADPWFLGMWVNPIIHRLFPPSHTPKSDEPDPGGVVELVTRLASLIYLSDVRVRLMEYHVTGYHFIEQLKSCMEPDVKEWEEFQELRLWVLVIGGLKVREEDRAFFVHQISEMMQAADVEAWEEVERVVKGFIWIEELYADMCRKLGREVMSGLGEKE